MPFKKTTHAHAHTQTLMDVDVGPTRQTGKRRAVDDGENKRSETKARLDPPLVELEAELNPPLPRRRTRWDPYQEAQMNKVTVIEVLADVLVKFSMDLVRLVGRYYMFAEYVGSFGEVRRDIGVDPTSYKRITASNTCVFALNEERTIIHRFNSSDRTFAALEPIRASLGLVSAFAANCSTGQLITCQSIGTSKPIRADTTVAVPYRERLANEFACVTYDANGKAEQTWPLLEGLACYSIAVNDRGVVFVLYQGPMGSQSGIGYAYSSKGEQLYRFAGGFTPAARQQIFVDPRAQGDSCWLSSRTDWYLYRIALELSVMKVKSRIGQQNFCVFAMGREGKMLATNPNIQGVFVFEEDLEQLEDAAYYIPTDHLRRHEKYLAADDLLRINIETDENQAKTWCCADATGNIYVTSADRHSIETWFM